MSTDFAAPFDHAGALTGFAVRNAFKLLGDGGSGGDAAVDPMVLSLAVAAALLLGGIGFFWLILTIGFRAARS